jgi:hypothetical protein
MMETIVIQAPPGTKSRWVKAAHPGKLSAWVVKMIDEEPNPDRFLRRILAERADFVVFPDDDLLALVRLSEFADDELLDLMRKAYLAGARRE